MCIIFQKNRVQSKNNLSVILIIKSTNTGVWMRDVFRRVGVLSIWYRSIRHFIFRFIFEQPTRYFKLIASHKYKQLQQNETERKNKTLSYYIQCIRKHIFIFIFIFHFVLCFCSFLAFKRGNICICCCYCIYICFIVGVVS